MWIRKGDDFIYAPAVLAVQVAILVFTTIQTKRFPNVD
jgi:hypothetical protein